MGIGLLHVSSRCRSYGKIVVTLELVRFEHEKTKAPPGALVVRTAVAIIPYPFRFGGSQVLVVREPCG